MIKYFTKLMLHFIVVFTASTAIAQVPKGKITGHVYTETGIPLYLSTLSLQENGQQVVTSTDGWFSFADLNPGEYTIAVSGVGYEKEQLKIELKANETYQAVIKCKASSTELQQVVVTAEKRETLLQNTPLAVTVIGSKQVQDNRIWSSKELTGLAPNLNTINSGNESNLISLRGINSFSLDPAVATYIDGVNQFTVYSNITLLDDIERIEILRGPQGTLYGRNAMGGVLNIITRQPANYTNGFAEASLGNYGLQRYRAGLNGPLIKDKLLYSITGLYGKRNGYFTNTNTQSDFDDLDYSGINARIKYYVNSRWTLDLNGKYYTNTTTGPFPYATSAEEAFAKPYQVNQNYGGKDKNQVLQTALNINHTGKQFNFVDIAAFQQTTRTYPAKIDADFSPLNLYSFSSAGGNQANRGQIFTNEFRFSGAEDPASKWRWIAGGYFFHQHDPQDVSFNAEPGASAVGDTNAPYHQYSISVGTNYGLAGFGELTYWFSQKFEITGGLRYDYENRELTKRTDFQKDPGAVTTIDTEKQYKGTFHALSPKLIASFHPEDNINLYASYTKGFRAGGLNALAGNPALVPYNPEFSNNYEVGFKTELISNKLRFNAAIFRIDWKDIQTTVYTKVNGQYVAITQNNAAAVNNGAEAELTYLPIKHLEINYSFGYIDAKYKSLDVPDATNPAVSINYDDNRVIFTPKVTSVLSTQYIVPVKTGNKPLDFKVRAQWNYIGEQFFDLENKVKQNPYQTFNLRTGLSSKYFDLYGWGQNIFDKKYLGFGFGSSYVMLATPATYGITLTAKF